MTTKRVDLNAFVGKDFDMERCLGVNPNTGWEIVANYTEDWSEQWECGGLQRPRLNKAQVPLDYSWLPDGIIWECRTGYGDNPIWSSEEVKENGKYGYIQWISAIGLHPDYEDQAKEWDYPVVEL